MPNAFLTAERIAAAALGLLQREILLPGLVTSVPQADFRGSKDDTITLRVPAVLTARDYTMRYDRTNPIVIDDLTELAVPVQLTSHPYSAVAITDEQLTLDIADFGLQVLQPQVRAVAEKLEDVIAAAMAAADVPADSEIELDEADPVGTALDARKILNINNVPMAGRALVLGANMERVFLGAEGLIRVDASGSDSVLRDATIGRVAGFTVVTSNAIDPDVGYAFHQTAIAFANVAPVVPDGATMGQSQTYRGLAMRWLRDYDPTHLQDRSVVSAFTGASTVTDGDPDTPVNMRLVKISTGS